MPDLQMILQNHPRYPDLNHQDRMERPECTSPAQSQVALIPFNCEDLQFYGYSLQAHLNTSAQQLCSLTRYALCLSLVSGCRAYIISTDIGKIAVKISAYVVHVGT